MTAKSLQRLIVFCVVFGFFCPAVAKAADSFVFCVQRQLNEIGLDVGPSDGVIGARTRAAITKLAEAHPALADLAPLDQANAPQWCDSIATRFPELAGDSAVARHVQFVFGPTVSAPDVKAIMGGTYFAFELYSSLFDYTLDHPVTVMFGKDRDWQLDRYMELKGIPDTFRGRSADAFWTSRETINGQVIGNNVLVTGLSDDFVQGDRQSVLELSAAGLLAHELYHVVVNQLAGEEYGRDQATLVGRVHNGPTWLEEGLAELLKKIALSRLSSLTLDELLAPDVQYSRDWAENAAPYLSELEVNPSVTADHYTLGSLAAQRLVDTHGAAAFLSYWREIGRGSDWITAFERAYGMTLDAFYDAFNADIERLDDPRRKNRIVVLEGPSPIPATTPDAIRNIQSAALSNPDIPPDALCVQMVLQERGYAIDSLNGLLDASTLLALEDYVKEHRQAHRADLISADSAARWCLYFQTYESLSGSSRDIAARAIESWKMPIDVVTNREALKAILFADADKNVLLELTSFADITFDGAAATRALAPYSKIASAEFICFALAEGWVLQDPSRGGTGGMCARIVPDAFINDGFIRTKLEVARKSG